MRRALGRVTIGLILGILWRLPADEAPVVREPAVQLNNRGSQMYAEGRWQDAEALFRRALDEWEPGGPGHAMAVGNLGATLRAMGRFGEAEKLLIDALRELEARGDETSISRTLVNLAALYRERGELGKAEECAKRANATGTAQDRADARLSLASIYYAEQRPDEAEALLESDLPIAQGKAAVVLYNNLATSASARHDFARSEELARRALQLARTSLAETHPLIGAILNNLAQACRFQGKYLDAETNYRKALEIWESALGPEHPDVARGLFNLASFYHDREREAGAEELFRQAGAIFARKLGEDHPETLITRNELADVLRAEHRYTESQRLSGATLPRLEKMLPAGDPRLTRARFNQAQLRRDLGLRAK